MSVDIDTLQIQVEAGSSKAAQQVNALADALTRLGRVIGGDGSLQKIVAQIGQVGQAAGKSSAGLDRMAGSAQKAAKTPSMSKLTKELAQAEKEANKTGDALLELQTKLDSLKELQGIGHRYTIADTNAKIKETETQINELAAAVDAADAKVQALRRSIQSVGSSTQPVQQFSDSVKSAASNCGVASTAAQKMEENLKSVSNAAQSISDKPIQDASNSLKVAAKNCGQVSDAAKQVKDRLKGASTAAEGLGKTTETAAAKGTNGLSKLSAVVNRIISRMIILRAITAILSAISEGIKTAASENAQVNATLSEIKSSLAYVQNALAAAILPIIQAIAPILTFILDTLAEILNFIAKIIAFFTGQKSVLQAVKTQESFADSLEDTASAAKEALKYLLPIDELNIMDGTSSGGGTTTNGVHFETVDTDFDIPDLSGAVIASPTWDPDPVPAPAFETVTVPAMAGETLASPQWDPNFVPAPVFETLPVPKLEGETLQSPAWEPNPIPAPAFEAVTMPEWAMAPLPIPEWEEDPVVAPALEPEPLLSGLAVLQEEFITSWEEIKQKANEAAESVQGVLGELQTACATTAQRVREATTSALSTAQQKVEQFATETQTKLQTWGSNIKTNYETTMNYIQTVTAPALFNAKDAVSSFASNTSQNIAAWGENVMSNVRTTIAYIPEAVASGFNSAAEGVASWVNSTSSNVAAWGNNLIQNAGSAIKGFYQNFVSGLSSAWEAFKGFMSATGEKIGSWWSANKSWVAPVAVGIGVTALAVGAIALSGGAAAPAVVALAALANGGVATEPTTALIGEYPGAKTNPEIVAPQNILRDTFREEQNTDEIINAIYAMGQQIVAAVNSNSGDIYLDGVKVGGRTTSVQNRQNRMYGKTLQNT